MFRCEYWIYNICINSEGNVDADSIDSDFQSLAMIFSHQNDKAIADALKVSEVDDGRYIDIIMHGSSDSVSVFGEKKNTQKFADFIEQRAGES